MTTKELTDQATRFLVSKAFEAGVLDSATYDFLTERPGRAGEVAEFVTWLARPEPMLFPERSEAAAFIAQHGLTAIVHESNAIGRHGFIVVVLHEGKQYGVVSETEMVELVDW